MSLQNALLLAQVLVLVASTLLNVYLYMRTRSTALWRAIADGDKAVTQKAEQLAEGVARSVDETVQQLGISRGVERDLDKRVAVVESHLRAIPTHADLVGIRHALANIETRLAEKISAVDERSTATHAAVTSLNRFLLERGK